MKVALGVSGGIAAYKAAELVRELQRYAERLEPAGRKEHVAWR